MLSGLAAVVLPPGAQASAGATWSDAGVFNPSPGGAAQAAIADDGSMVGAWISQAPDAQLVTGISVARRSSAGSWSQPTFVRALESLVTGYRLVSTPSTQHGLLVMQYFDRPDEVLVAASSDFGATWSDPESLNVRISMDGPTSIYAGPVAAVSDDGMHMAVALGVAAPTADDEMSAVLVVTSDDGGVTWDQPQALAERMYPETVSSPSLDFGPDGALLVGWLEADRETQALKVSLRESGGTWSTPSTAAVRDGITRIDWGSFQLSADGSRVVGIYGTTGIGKDLVVRVATVSGTSLTWSEATSATANIEDESFTEPNLDINDEADFAWGGLFVSQDAQRIVLPFKVLPNGTGSASRAGVVVSTDRGATWGDPTWLSSGRSDVERVTASGSADAMTIDVTYTAQVYGPVVCEEPSEECVPTDEPANGASLDEKGTWIATSTNGGTEWSTQHRVSADVLAGVLPFGSSDGEFSAVLWTESSLSMRWVQRGFGASTQAPSAPRSVTTTRKPRGLQVSWQVPLTSGSSAVTTYRATASPGGRTCQATAPTRTCLISVLTPGQSYTVAVEARNATHEGWSDPGTSRPIVVAGPPSPVTGVSVKRTGRGTVTLTWSAPGATGGIPLTSYRVSYRAVGAAKATVRADLTPTKRSLAITGLAAGKTYTFTVFAENDVAASVGASSKPYRAS